MSFLLWSCLLKRLIFLLWLAPASFFCILCPSPCIWDPRVSTRSLSSLRWSCSPLLLILSSPLAPFPKRLDRLWSHSSSHSSGVGAILLGLKRPGRVADHPTSSTLRRINPCNQIIRQPSSTPCRRIHAEWQTSVPCAVPKTVNGLNRA